MSGWDGIWLSLGLLECTYCICSITFRYLNNKFRYEHDLPPLKWYQHVYTFPKKDGS